MASVTNSQVEAIANGRFPEHVVHNASPARLYQDSLLLDNGQITSTGGIASMSGAKTGRSPKDKRIVDQVSIHDDVWWGDINIPLESSSYDELRAQAIGFLNGCSPLYVIDAFAGWDPASQIKVRIICSRAYHALFMHNMLIRPTPEQLQDFGKPDYVIYNAGQATANPSISGVESETCVAVNFDCGEMVILGTEYAGEMKKGVFTIMNFLMPKNDVMSMHCSANEGVANQDVSLFFGLSGTGKTTLSADPERRLIGDDEHGWNETGVFNIEGGCYAKCINLSAENEPEIFNAIRYGAILENTVQDPVTHEVDFSDISVTPNTRCSYPIDYIENAKIPCVGSHPRNIILLTCDAFGVLPPVSKLTPGQAMYHFISGYTAKVAGTEVGVNEPEVTFSACFGAAFLVWHPMKYAELLAEKMRDHGTTAWLVNTGWSGGAYGVGERIQLKHTRAIVDAIHNGDLEGVEFDQDLIFGLAIPTHCSGVPEAILNPRKTWSDMAAFDATARKLAAGFNENFELYADQATREVVEGGPVIRD
ncbi:MAG: phosphoenolpyruvate carboxykinase (ATP) [Mariniblastus sp.]|nr:phosphoenolpyruvate carboxykinase (ATP) [Mariniblastus sp.]